MAIQERYTPVVIAANSSVDINGSGIGSFFCTASGTLTIENKRGETILNAFSVTAGEYYPLHFYLQGNGGTVTTASSGAGVIGVA